MTLKTIHLLFTATMHTNGRGFCIVVGVGDSLTVPNIVAEALKYPITTSQESDWRKLSSLIVALGNSLKTNP